MLAEMSLVRVVNGLIRCMLEDTLETSIKSHPCRELYAFVSYETLLDDDAEDDDEEEEVEEEVITRSSRHNDATSKAIVYSDFDSLV